MEEKKVNKFGILERSYLNFLNNQLYVNALKIILAPCDVPYADRSSGFRERFLVENSIIDGQLNVAIHAIETRRE